MKIGVLTSSRADFGIYSPLLQLLQNDSFFKLEIIAFGTHTSKKHGETINEIKPYNFEKIHALQTIPKGDTPFDIAASVSETTKIFAYFWNENKFDWVICLGDRFEMFAAVSAGAPFNVKFAHIHAGETTLGAIDNAYRHAISLFSKILFTSTDIYKQRAEEIVGTEARVYNVGALSIDNLKKIQFLNPKEIFDKFEIDVNIPSILSTFHPETVGFENNKFYIKEILASFDVLKKDYQIIITLPNTDTMGQMIRDKIQQYGIKNPEIKIVESFGMLGYLSVMKNAAFLLGNTSSGFVEAAFFPKFVINLGERQKGRILTPNILQTNINKKEILEAVDNIKNHASPNFSDIYGNGDTAEKIIQILKD